MSIQIALLMMASAAAVPAAAQPSSPPPPSLGAPSTSSRAAFETGLRQRLGLVDTNKDGTIGPDEMRAYAQVQAKARYDAEFVTMDADRNGQISRAEFDAQHSGRPAEPGRGGAGGGMRAMRGLFGPEVATESFRGGQPVVVADVVADSLQRFDATDANRDGTVTTEERRAMRERLTQARGGRDNGREGRGSGEQPEQD